MAANFKNLIHRVMPRGISRLSKNKRGQATIELALAVIAEASLSYLGVGMPATLAMEQMQLISEEIVPAVRSAG